MARTRTTGGEPTRPGVARRVGASAPGATPPPRQRRGFRPLADHFLERCTPERLLTYIRTAHADGHTAAGQRGQQLLAWQYRDRLRGYAYTHAPRDELEDVVSDAIAGAGRTTFRGNTLAEFRGWIFTILRNQTTNTFRSRERNPAVTFDSLSDPDNPAWRASAGDWAGAADVAMERDAVLADMRPDHRLAVRLALVDGDLPPGEVAELLGDTRSNVYQQICRFRKQLRERLDQAA